MKAKLIKTEVNYILEDDKGVVIASTSLKKDGLALSLKNCQSIERGYDLDDLAKIEYPICEVWNDEEALIRELAFKKGFQKALEILGDKKFSEEDMRRALSAGLSIGYGRQFEIENKQVEIDSYMKSLQQTEWDVEIEKENVMYDYNGNISLGAKFKLDADGCLILKLKSE